MSDEIEPIKQDIEATRSSIIAKVEAIQEKLTDTVADIPQTVQATVQDAVQGTVDQVQQTISATTESVKQVLDTTGASVKQAFDLKQQVNAHPWAMFGASFAVGLVLGSLANNEQPRYGTQGGNTGVADLLDQEFNVLKQATWATMQQLVRESLHHYVPHYTEHAQQLGVGNNPQERSGAATRNDQ